MWRTKSRSCSNPIYFSCITVGGAYPSINKLHIFLNPSRARYVNTVECSPTFFLYQIAADRNIVSIMNKSQCFSLLWSWTLTRWVILFLSPRMSSIYALLFRCIAIFAVECCRMARVAVVVRSPATSHFQLVLYTQSPKWAICVINRSPEFGES